MVWLLLALAASQASQYWDLTDTLPSFHGSEYLADWTVTQNTDCPTAHMSQGSLLCSAGSPAVCGSLEDILDLCHGMESCHSVSWLSGVEAQGKGYLNSFSCGAAAVPELESRTSLYTKSFYLLNDLESCPMGTAAKLKGGGELSGVYEKTSFTTFQHLDSLARIVWHNSGCGWVVQAANYTPATPTPAADTCKDLDDVVATIFASPLEDSTPCATAAAWSGATTYCAHPVFAALCPVSCSTDCEVDKDDAVAQWTGGTCATASCDAIVSLFCPESCGRRLGTSDLAELPAAPAHVLQSLRALPRRLGWDLGPGGVSAHEEVYRTFASPNDDHCTRVAPDPDLLNFDGLFDVRAFHSPVEASLTHSCPSGDTTWLTVKDSYCSRMNIPALHTEHKAVGVHGCTEKCGDSVADGVTADGVNDWCSGNDADFTELTDALCLPREQCEALCESLSECSSFDMHRELPRCYLNTLECDFTDVGDHTASSEYDLVGKSATPDAASGGAVSDHLRDTFVTYTGADCSGVTRSSTTQLPRKDCELLCSTTEDCVGFELVDVAGAGGDDSDCTLILDEACFEGLGPVANVTVAADRSHVEVVKLVPHKPCTVVVAPLTAWTGEEFGGVYVKTNVSSTSYVLGHNYLREDNSSRLAFSGPLADQRSYCRDWFFETNIADPVTVTLHNCTDAPVALVNYYVKSLDDGQAKGNEEFPCQHGFDMGRCVDDVFMSLCPHTCTTTFLSTSIAGKTYTYQDLDIFGDHGTCSTDNNWGIYAFMSLRRGNGTEYDTATGDEKLTAFRACANVTTGDVQIDGADVNADWLNHTHNPCTETPFSPILQWLCPESCALVTDPTAPPPGAASDETEAGGATWSHTRKLLPDTVSRLHLPSTIEVKYMNAEQGIWRAALNTYVNGSHDSDSPYYDPTCSGLAPVQDSQEFYDLLDRFNDGAYELRIPKSKAKLEYACRGASPCPSFSSCVLLPQRMEIELDALYDSGDKAAMLAAAPFINFTTYQPKALISENRATALLAGVERKWELTPKIFRSALGAPIVEITSLGEGIGASSFLVTLASPTASEGYYAETELGRTYGAGPGAGYGPWLSDVIRVQKFDDAGAAQTGTASFKVYLGASKDAHLMRFFATTGGTPVRLSVPSNGYSPTGYSHALYTIGPNGASVPSGWYQFDAPYVNADFIAAMDVDECAASPCAEKASCTNGNAAMQDDTYTCTCDSGFEGDPYTSCSLSPTSYGDFNNPQYVRITPLSKLEHGWRVKEIVLYSDECFTTMQHIKVGAEMPIPADPDDTTYTVLTQYSNVYTGPPANPVFGLSHYPHPTDLTEKPKYNNVMYGNTNLFDETGTKGVNDDLDTEWWSECLQCEAEEVVIEFAIQSGVDLGCIRLIQVDGHAPTSVKVEWGPMTGPGCSMAAGGTRCPPTMVYVETDSKARPIGADVTIPFTCGVADTQIFGEILKVDSGAGTWEGSYPARLPQATTTDYTPVATACACHQLCVLHIDQGCRTYKFLDTAHFVQGRDTPFKHCYLQLDAFAPGSGYYGKAEATGFTGYTSGRVADRYVKNGQASVLPWVL
jgi:hypothetical protein